MSDKKIVMLPMSEELYHEFRANIERAKSCFLEELVMNVHHCLHAQQFELATKMLCRAASMIDEAYADPTPDELEEMFLMMQKASSEREKADCEGSA